MFTSREEKGPDIEPRSLLASVQKGQTTSPNITEQLAMESGSVKGSRVLISSDYEFSASDESPITAGRRLAGIGSAKRRGGRVTRGTRERKGRDQGGDTYLTHVPA
jgi:hypothetical protein